MNLLVVFAKYNLQILWQQFYSKHLYNLARYISFVKQENLVFVFMIKLCCFKIEVDCLNFSYVNGIAFYTYKFLRSDRIKMSKIHESVFAKYQRRNDVQLDFSEENPMKKYEFGDEIGRFDTLQVALIYFALSLFQQRRFARFFL